MKKYIQSSMSLQNGSYLLDRQGNLYPVKLHVPSTTYMSRGILHLCPTDIDFLLTNGLADEEDGEVVYWYCLHEYLGTLHPTIADRMRFDIYCELKYTSILKNLVGLASKCPYSEDELTYLIEDFEDLNDKWYPYCKNNFVKVSVMCNNVEFRITSEDDFDWNTVIIDDCILPNSRANDSSTRYTILRESSKGYRDYFVNVTLNEILEEDKYVLSSKYLRRIVEGGSIKYVQ